MQMVVPSEVEATVNLPPKLSVRSLMLLIPNPEGAAMNFTPGCMPTPWSLILSRSSREWRSNSMKALGLPECR